MSMMNGGGSGGLGPQQSSGNPAGAAPGGGGGGGGMGQICRLITLGDSATGKSSLLHRYTDGVFDEDIKPTMGIDFRFKNVVVRDRDLKIQVWDTAGQERFRTITFSYYRGAHGILLVYDVTSPSSFHSIRKWISDIQTYAEPDVCLLLIGNKLDLEAERKVSWEQGQQLAQEYNIGFIECSAKEDVNVERAFNSLVEEVLDHWIATGEGNLSHDGTEDGKTVDLDDGSDAKDGKKKRRCCK